MCVALQVIEALFPLISLKTRKAQIPSQSSVKPSHHMPYLINPMQTAPTNIACNTHITMQKQKIPKQLSVTLTPFWNFLQ